MGVWCEMQAMRARPKEPRGSMGAGDDQSVVASLDRSALRYTDDHAGHVNKYGPRSQGP